jgi:hypothetical protein
MYSAEMNGSLMATTCAKKPQRERARELPAAHLGGMAAHRSAEDQSAMEQTIEQGKNSTPTSIPADASKPVDAHAQNTRRAGLS